jgi:4-phosphopantoate--beta-alanine ligase
MTTKIPLDHPRAESLRIREALIEGFDRGIVSRAGLIAHGRGEAFDYLLGERTMRPALRAIEASAAMLLNAKKPVISVNGNAAALAAKEIVRLSKITNSQIEVNLFYRSLEREEAIGKVLREAGAKEILGIGGDANAKIPELSSQRRRVDSRGILKADVIVIPLEDGDRTEALIKLRKKVIAIDLNPLSRTSRKATITIVDNIVRAIPQLAQSVERLKNLADSKCEAIIESFDNKRNLARSLKLIKDRLAAIADKDLFLIKDDETIGL